MESSVDYLNKTMDDFSNEFLENFPIVWMEEFLRETFEGFLKKKKPSGYFPDEYFEKFFEEILNLRCFNLSRSNF